MILTKSFYTDTTKGLDVKVISHEVRRVIKEANTDNGSMTVVSPARGAGFLILDVADKPETAKKSLETLQSNGTLAYLLPKTLTIPIEKGKLSIDPWQELFLVDYEASAKRREFRVQVVTEPPPPQPQQGEGGIPLGSVM